MERRTFLKTLILSSGALLFNAPTNFASFTDENDIKLLMIYNNMGSSKKLVNVWGLSIWIEEKNNAVLFDTGGNPSILLGNIKQSGIDLTKLSKVVISHNHWDHVGGLSAILEEVNNNPIVYVPSSDVGEFQNIYPHVSFEGVNEPIRLCRNMWSTGQMEGVLRDDVVYEQSLLVTTGNSTILLTGCSHPGIVKISKKSKKILPAKELDAVIGGFHLLQHSEKEIKEISLELKNLGVKRIAPSHCTGELAMQIFSEKWEHSHTQIDFFNGNTLKV